MGRAAGLTLAQRHPQVAPRPQHKTHQARTRNKISAFQTGDWLTFWAIAVAGLGLAFTGYSIHRSNRNSSAASLIALNEAWRQAWERFLRAKDETIKEHQFAELLNILEIACALRMRKVLTGVSRELLTEYLDSVMELLNSSEYAKERLEALIHSKTTFKYLGIYIRYLRKRRDALTVQGR